MVIVWELVEGGSRLQALPPLPADDLLKKGSPVTGAPSGPISGPSAFQPVLLGVSTILSQCSGCLPVLPVMPAPPPRVFALFWVSNLSAHLLLLTDLPGWLLCLPGDLSLILGTWVFSEGSFYLNTQES